MFGIGSRELLIFLVIVLILFGPKNLPRLAQALGKSVRELKNGLAGVGDDIKQAMDEKPSQPVNHNSSNAPADQSDAQPVDSTTPRQQG